MTAIFYPDRTATSPDGRLTLEARSPQNGVIPHRDGTRAADTAFELKYRAHQKDFRIRLLDRLRPAEAQVLWERWQGRGEDSPHELVVSDDGWSVIRTHGFSPEVIAVSPEGGDVVRVRVLGDDGSGRSSEGRSRTQPRFYWRAKRLARTTAGSYWAGHSWTYFLRHGGSHPFVWRTYWGQRLVLDLSQAALVSDEGREDASLGRAMDDEEKRGACDFLAEMAQHEGEIERVLATARGPQRETVEGHPLREKLGRVGAAIHLAGVHRAHECLPLLRWWEAIDFPACSTGSTAMSKGWWLEVQHFRPIAQNALRLLGAVPQGYATYHFSKHDKERFPMPERITGRRQRAAEADRGMSAEQVLGLIGSPDHVRRRSHPVGTLFEWTEEWEYDFRVAEQWETLRITWAEHRRHGRIASIETVPAYWLEGDERVLDLWYL